MDPVSPLAELDPRLSISARDALEYANGYRAAVGLEEVHVHHLLVGLLTKPDTVLRTALEHAGVPLEEVPTRLAELRVRAPSWNGRDFGLRRAPIESDVRFSTNATLALRAALSHSLASGDPYVRHVDLVRGLADVRDAPTVRAFERALVLVPELQAEHDEARARDDDAERPAAEPEPASQPDAARASPTSAPEAPPEVEQTRAPATSRAQTAPTSPTPTPTPPAPAVGLGGGAFNDRPERAADRLNFGVYVRAFADLVDSPASSPPLTIGIFGSWGAGKSFLLTRIRETLDARAAAIARASWRARRRRRWTHRLRAARAVLDTARGAAAHDGVPWLWRAAARWWERGYRARVRRAVERGTPIPDDLPPPAPLLVHCVGFNAWEYNASERIWPRLVRAVLETVDDRLVWWRHPTLWAARTARRVSRNAWRVVRRGWVGLLGWLGVGLVVGAVAAFVRPDARGDVLRFVIDTDVTGEKLTIPALAAGLAALAKLLRDVVIAPVGSWITALLDDGIRYGAPLDYMAAIKADLDLLERRLSADAERVFLVVDDLDRCEPSKMIEVLQAVNLLLDRPSFIVCLGIDARIVTAAVERHYEALLGPAGMSGYEYLDKIVQIPFLIPEPTAGELQSLIDAQLGADGLPRSKSLGEIARGLLAETQRAAEALRQVDEGARAPTDAATSDADAPRLLPDVPRTTQEVRRAVAAQIDDAYSLAGAFVDEAAAARAERPDATELSFTPDEVAAFHAVAPFLRPNPRHVKRLVNVYALVRSVLRSARDERAARVLTDPEAIVRWLTLCAQWPYAARAMTRHLAAHDDAALEAERARTVADRPPLAALLRWAGPSLDETLRHRFDHDAALLDALVENARSSDWDDLRILRRYTLNFNPALDGELRARAARVAAASTEPAPIETVVRRLLDASVPAPAPSSASAAESREPRAESPAPNAPPVARV